MVDESSLLAIRRRFPRPTPEQVAALGGVPTGNLVDAVGGRTTSDVFDVSPTAQSRMRRGETSAVRTL